MRIVLCLLAAAAVSFTVGHFLLPMLRALKAGQSIREIGPAWHASKSGTPTMGGLMFLAGMLVSLLFAIPEMRQGDFTSLFLALFTLAFALIGFLDDFMKVKYHRNLGLTALQKLLLQLAASGIFLALLRWNGSLSNELFIPFWKVTVRINWIVYFLFAMFVMVGCVNAVNLTDGIDGLAAGVSIPVMIFFIVAALLQKKAGLGLFPAAMAGGLAGFLCYNFHPAKVFMGDTGSLSLGAAVCAIAFALNMPLILIVVGIIYIIETVSVILQVGYFKLTHGKRIFRMTPIHHHYEMKGWSEVKIFCVFTAITVAACILGYFGIN